MKQKRWKEGNFSVLIRTRLKMQPSCDCVFSWWTIRRYSEFEREIISIVSMMESSCEQRPGFTGSLCVIIFSFLPTSLRDATQQRSSYSFCGNVCSPTADAGLCSLSVRPVVTFPRQRPSIELSLPRRPRRPREEQSHVWRNWTWG